MNRYLDFSEQNGGIGFIKSEKHDFASYSGNQTPYECVTLVPANYLISLLLSGKELSQLLQSQGEQLMEEWRMENAGVTNLRTPLYKTYPLSNFTKERHFKSSKTPYSRAQKSRFEIRLDTHGA